MAAVALVLLIACANVAGLLFARGCTRRRELAVRSALGGSGGRLARQLLTETAVLAVTAGLVGLLLASWLQAILLRVTPLESLGVAEVGVDATVLLFALALSVTTALVSGLVPALRSGRAQPAVDLHAGARTTDTRAGTRALTIFSATEPTVSLSHEHSQIDEMLRHGTRWNRNRRGFAINWVNDEPLAAPHTRFLQIAGQAVIISTIGTPVEQPATPALSAFGRCQREFDRIDRCYQGKRRCQWFECFVADPAQ